MQLPLTTLFCVGYYNPNRKGFELEPSQREIIIKYHPKKPLSREIANSKYQRVILHPHTTEVTAVLSYFNSIFAGYTLVNGPVGDQCITGYHLNGKVYTRNNSTNKCYMWTVPFNVPLNGLVDVYGSRPNPTSIRRTLCNTHYTTT